VLANQTPTEASIEHVTRASAIL